MKKSNDFNEKCYSLLKLIPEGKVTTYKELARALGTTAWRAVGTALSKNSNLIVIPCHRVVRSDGTVGQYALGVNKKVELLTQEGLKIQKGKVQNFDNHIFKYTV